MEDLSTYSTYIQWEWQQRSCQWSWWYVGLLHVLILYQEILNGMSHVATLLAISSCVARHPETFTWPAHICSETKHLSHGPWEHRLRLLLSRHVVTQLLLMLWGAWSITNLAGQPLLEQGRALKVSSLLSELRSSVAQQSLGLSESASTELHNESPFWSRCLPLFHFRYAIKWPVILWSLVWLGFRRDWQHQQKTPCYQPHRAFSLL